MTMLLLTALLIAQPASEPTQLTLDLDQRAGLLYARLWKVRGTIGSGFAHDHVIAAKRWRGRIVYTPDPIKCDVRFSLAVADLDPDDPALRKRFAIEGELSDDKREDVADNMRRPDQLDAAKHKTIAFQSTACHGRGGRLGTIDVEGDVTIRGKAKRVRFPLEFEWAKNLLTAKGSFVVQHEDFGMTPYSTGLGAIKNGSDIEIGVDLKAAIP
jgi:polyisoprenoid-binding protein YceI